MAATNEDEVAAAHLPSSALTPDATQKVRAPMEGQPETSKARRRSPVSKVDKDPDTSEGPTKQPLVRRVAHWVILIAGTIYGGAFVLGGAMTMLQSPELFDLALRHFPATIGLPSAAIAALCIVVFLESSSGPIEFEGLGFRFKGASGPIVLWVLCFLAIAGAIKLLWAPQ